MTEQKINKWEYFSKIRVELSTSVLENETAFYKKIYEVLKKLTNLEVVVIISKSVTYKNHIAVINENGIETEKSWDECFNNLSINAKKLRQVIWKNEKYSIFNDEKKVLENLFSEDFHIENLPIKSWFSCPLIRPGTNVLGAIVVYSKNKKDKFTYEDEDFLINFADNIAILFKNKRIFNRYEVLNNCVFDIKNALSFDEVENQVLNISYGYAKKLMNVDNFLAFIVPESITDKSINPELRLSYKNGNKENTSANAIFLALAKYNIENPTEKILLSNKLDVKTKLSQILDIKQDKLTMELPETIIVVPMNSDKETSKIRGTFILYHPSHIKAYDEDDRKVIDRLSDQAAFVIENAHLQKQLEKSTVLQELQNTLIIKTAREITSEIGINKQGVLNSLDSIIREAYNDEKNIYIALYDKELNEIEFPIFYIDGKKEEYTRRPFGNGRTEWIIKKGEPLLIPTKQDSIDWYKTEGTDYIKTKPLSSWIGVPIMLKKSETVYGVIAMYHPSLDNLYNEENLDVLKSWAIQVAAAFKSAETYQELKETNKKLEIANQNIAETQDILTKALIANDLVHRLNNAAGTIPIWSNLIAIELEKNNPSLEAIKNHNLQIKDDIDKLLRMVENLKNSEKDSEIDIKLMLEILLRHLSLQFQAYLQNHKLEICPLSIIGDLYKIYGISSTIYSVIHGVIANAIDAVLEKGYGKILISARNVDKSIEIKIEDTGIGISPENLDKIFTPYFTTKSGNHFGYGLWRAKFVLEKLGGSIYAESEEKNGSIFTITIPAIRFVAQISNSLIIKEYF